MKKDSDLQWYDKVVIFFSLFFVIWKIMDFLEKRWKILTQIVTQENINSSLQKGRFQIQIPNNNNETLISKRIIITLSSQKLF